MLLRTCLMSAGAAVAMAFAYAAPADALTMRECSVKYKAAESAGTLGGMKWRDFRRAECGPGADAGPAATGTTTPTPPTAARPAAPTAAPYVGNAVFPTAVSPKYANQSAGRARMRTCLEQYEANKATNGNGGLRWIQKGGGYYSECNKRLSGR